MEKTAAPDNKIYTAIVADDEPIIRLDLSEQLSQGGVRVLGQAADGFDAVALAEQYHPDLVIMDIKMPVFDGLTAAREIIRRQLAGTVVLSTAFCDEEFIAQAREIGVGGYLVKPIQSRQLMATVEIALAQSRRYASAEARERQSRQKLDALRKVERAKALLAAEKGISEPEALRLMQRECMNKRCTLDYYAEKIVARVAAEEETLRRAKALLSSRYGLSEKAAYTRLKQDSSRRGLTIAAYCRLLLEEEK